MTFDELLNEMKAFEGTDEYKNYIAGFITDDSVKQYLGTENGKKLLQPQLDSYFNKGLETWKTNNLSKLVDEEHKKRYPDADPKDTELAAVKAELEKMKAENLRKDLTNKALTLANEKGLPVDLIDFFIGSDEKTTTANIEKFNKVFASSVSAAVDTRLKDSNYAPPDGADTDVMDGVTAAFKNLNPTLNIK